MDFKQIEAFVNVVRYKNFSKAADATFFTQPTLSTHVANLEEELGVKLLDRHGRTVEMTPQGAEFYKYAVEMINARSQAFEALKGSHDTVSGILEIQASSIPGVTFLPEILTEFRNKHDNIQYYVTLSDTQNVIDNILDRRGEIGFVGDRIDANALEYTKVFTDKVIMIAPKSFGITSPLTMAEAVKYPFLWRESGSATRKSFEKTATGLGFDKNAFNIAGLFNDLDSIIRSVETGLGVAILSRSVADTIGTDRVSHIEISDFSDERDFYMVRLRNTSLSPAAEAFSEYVKTR